MNPTIELTSATNTFDPKTSAVIQTIELSFGMKQYPLPKRIHEEDNKLFVMFEKYNDLLTEDNSKELMDNLALAGRLFQMEILVGDVAKFTNTNDVLTNEIFVEI